MDATVQAILDRQEIIDWIHAYCRWVDHNRPDEQVKMFTADCRTNFAAGEDGWVEGRDNVEQWIRSALQRYAATHHQVSNIEITFDPDGDGAGARTYLHAVHRHVDETKPDFHLYAHYVDRWVRTAEGWRCSQRRLEVSTTSGRPTTGLQMIDRVPT
jgi:SnoaL-like domain